MIMSTLGFCTLHQFMLDFIKRKWAKAISGLGSFPSNAYNSPILGDIFGSFFFPLKEKCLASISKHIVQSSVAR